MGFIQPEVTAEEFLSQAKEKLSNDSFKLVSNAYCVAEEYHRPQKRLSGQPYIIHPVNVAHIIMNSFAPDDKMISAGLLHDVVEDTSYSKEMMKKDFGEEITELVIGVTKVSQIRKNQTKEEVAAENVRRILMASFVDPRVIMIKLADKTHNMRTLGFQPSDKQERIAKEAFAVYAPLAGRLGIYAIKSELEDLAFQILYPDEYQKIKRMVSEKKSEREGNLQEIIQLLEKKMKEANIEVKIEGRAKHFYSIHKKLTLKEKKVEEIFDLRAVRIITKELRDCYGALGIVHTQFIPIPGRFKDYIASPKTNLYQSLHTTVISTDGKPLEVQIRTEDMNRIAERGIAAHWTYKEGKYNQIEDKFITRWKERLHSLTSDASASEFIDDLSGELHEDEVFAFTPKGDVFEFPKGSTVLDFAFRIHTNVGLHTKAGKVNGKIVPIRTELVSGDQVEIITEKNMKPSPIWARILKTASARQKLRQYFRKLHEDEGTEFVANKTANISIRNKDLEDVKKERQEKKEKNRQKKKDISIVVGGLKDILVRYASCCTPIPGDPVVGFITRGRGVTVHKQDCAVAQKNSDKKRLLNVRWDGVHKPVPVRIEVRAYDRPRIYLEIVKSISSTETNILEAGASSGGEGTMIARFLIEIEHLDQLEEIIETIKSIQNIISVERIKTK
ncbi:MAG: bifunctional (p)ppGpp synthetase/guanosine-3',5'-bis(diphosphate) 3'-pyrophosphohydrolase [Leptospiraceae bacterium]|nr:bifunctional (p)ppGpp synthetase/guanosine-3',5'-bis(diphosphate) 3'-pyrophosphohydrolase [Leptospiraceae bacterium]